MRIICKCGKEFNARPSLIKSGRKKYCSKKCLYMYRIRPTGLSYNIKTKNEGWFKKGHKPWNTGKPRPELLKKDVGYDALHDWVNRWSQKPNECESCGGVSHLEWANKSGEYKRNLGDWLRLCKKCHCRYDYVNFGSRQEFYR